MATWPANQAQACCQQTAGDSLRIAPAQSRLPVGAHTSMFSLEVKAVWKMRDCKERWQDGGKERQAFRMHIHRGCARSHVASNPCVHPHPPAGRLQPLLPHPASEGCGSKCSTLSQRATALPAHPPGCD